MFLCPACGSSYFTPAVAYQATSRDCADVSTLPTAIACLHCGAIFEWRDGAWMMVLASLTSPWGLFATRRTEHMDGRA